MTSTARRPDVVLVTMDAVRADRVGSLGGSSGRMPELDRLAERAARFTQAVTAGSWTEAAFPALLTSTYASMHGGCDGPLAASRPSPIERLAAVGYDTAAFSTNPLIGAARGYARGFGTFVELEPSATDPWLRQVRGGQRLLRRTLFHRSSGCRFKPAKPYATAEEVLERAIRWLEGAGSPSFAWLHLMDAHWPYHRDSDLREPAALAAAWRDLGAFHRRPEEPAAIDAEQAARWRDLYDRGVGAIDAMLGELTSALRARGRDPLWVVVADHGEELLEHDRWGHHEDNLHDEILRVPWIVRVPEGRGGTITGQVSTIDLMPTVLELCDCPPPAGMVGRSLGPLLRGEAGRDAVAVAYCERPRPDSHLVAVRTATWKLVWSRERPDQDRLYDLGLDPGERTNRAGRDPARREQGRALVAAHLDRVRAAPGGDSPATSAPPSAPTPELERRLRALGYLR